MKYRFLTTRATTTGSLLSLVVLLVDELLRLDVLEDELLLRLDDDELETLLDVLWLLGWARRG